jgi:hypothetical protein
MLLMYEVGRRTRGSFMSTRKDRLLFCVCLMALSCGLTLSVAGCGSSNPNETEFLNSAPPGKPSEFPNETFAQRKERTLRTPSKTKKEMEEAKDKGIEAKGP